MPTALFYAWSPLSKKIVNVIEWTQHAQFRCLQLEKLVAGIEVIPFTPKRAMSGYSCIDWCLDKKKKEMIQSSKTGKRRIVGVCDRIRKLNEPSLLPRLKFRNRVLNDVAVFDVWIFFFGAALKYGRQNLNAITERGCLLCA